MMLPDADPLHEENVRPADRNGQAIPTNHTTSPQAAKSQEVMAMCGHSGAKEYVDQSVAWPNASAEGIPAGLII
jgi:hypothetical protein